MAEKIEKIMVGRFSQIEITIEQEASLDRLYERDLSTVASNIQYEKENNTTLPDNYKQATWTDKVAMFETVCPGPGCIMIPWRGMWLGIEPDGYMHS